jgi:UDP-GlcNAc:undecaprenyl-phosphate GlcNAc-1-phosphate transferase
VDNALQFIPILVVGFFASLSLTPVARQLAFRLGVVAIPAQRNIHSDHKPLMGGLAIFTAFALSLLLFSPPRHVAELGSVLLGASLLAITGLVDDRYGLGIRIRLLVMTAAAGILIAAGIHISLFKTLWLDAPLTILWIVTLTNATNFMDNMDGLTAGMASIAGFFFLLIAWTQGLTLVTALAAALLGSAVGFLIYNFNPSSIFMGDMGALPLGFVLGVLGIKLTFQTQPPNVTWMIPLLVLALPLFDICLVVVTRLMEGRSPGQGGKDHTSHRLMSIGFNQRQTLLILYGAAALFGLIALVVSAAEPAVAFRVGIAALVILAGLFALMMWVRRRYQNS